MHTDTDEYWLEAALLQSGHPIAFASKTLTDIETHYAHIEWECLLACFSLERFYSYIYGRHVMVQNDHNPLEMIQIKPIHMAPTWFLQMLLCMQKYNYIIQYRPGKEMMLADHLSHFPSHSNSLSITQNVQHSQLSNAELDIIWGSIEHDPVYITVYCHTLRGWPKQRLQVPWFARHFWGTCDALLWMLAYFSREKGYTFPPE